MQNKGKLFLAIIGLLFLLLLLVYITDGISGQSEPGQPDTSPLYSTQGAVTDPAPLPPVLNGTLPPTVTPWPTPRATPTLALPTSQPPPGCSDCGGQTPGIVFTLHNLFSKIASILRGN